MLELAYGKSDRSICYSCNGLNLPLCFSRVSWPENTDLKGNCNNAHTFFIFLFEITFKTMYNALLLLFHMLLTSTRPTNILTERNEMSAIFNFCRYACHVTAGVKQYFCI
jgi:hypothetical protein